MCQFDYTCNVVADIDGIDEIVNCQLSTVDSVNADSVNIVDIANITNTYDRALYRFYARQIKCPTH